jgi:hypothetical protein
MSPRPKVEAAIARALAGPPIGRLIDIGHRHRPDDRIVRPKRRPGARRRPLPRNAAASPGSSWPRPGFRPPSSARATCMRCRCIRIGGHGDPPPGAPLCAAAGVPPSPRRRACSRRAGGC